MATFDYNRVNLGSARLITSITESSTTINVGTGDAETLPAVPFYATIMPSGGVPNTLNSEIVKVTANNSGTLTVVRAQRGTYAKEFPIGAVLMNGTYVEDLLQGQAVGKSFFSATLSGGVFSIDDSRLTNNPADGDSIRVVFGSDLTSGNCQLSLNGGTAKNVYAGGNLKAGASSTTNAMVKSGVVYELTYYNGSWYILNLVADSSVSGDNIKWDNSVISSELGVIGTNIASNDDLDNYTTPGFYVCSTAGVAQTLANNPHTTTAFKLKVEYSTADVRIRQTILANSFSSDMYVRNYYNAGWSKWWKVDASDKYSSNEQLIGTWTDGKPLYKKSVFFGNLPNNAAKSVAHGITGLRYCEDIKAVATTADYATQLKLPWVSADRTNAVSLAVVGNNITITTSSDRSGMTAWVTLEYTKNADY